MKKLFLLISLTAVASLASADDNAIKAEKVKTPMPVKTVKVEKEEEPVFMGEPIIQEQEAGTHGPGAGGQRRP